MIHLAVDKEIQLKQIIYIQRIPSPILSFLFPTIIDR